MQCNPVTTFNSLKVDNPMMCRSDIKLLLSYSRDKIDSCGKVLFEWLIEIFLRRFIFMLSINL